MKITIYVDTITVFNPVDAAKLQPIAEFGTKGVEVPEEFYHEYLEASTKFFEMNSQLEELYRAQRGLPNHAHNAVVVDLDSKKELDA